MINVPRHSMLQPDAIRYHTISLIPCLSAKCQFRDDSHPLLSLYPRFETAPRRLLRRFDASPDPDPDPDPGPFEMRTGWCSGRLSGFSRFCWALAAACFSHISFDLRQISSICSLEMINNVRPKTTPRTDPNSHQSDRAPVL